MGGCTSKQSAEKHERVNSNSLANPFFRRESPWIEREIYEDPSGFIPLVIKETVLQNFGCKENFNNEQCSDQTVDPRFINEDDHYDKIDENEMEDRRKSTYSTSPLLKPRKREKKSKSKYKRKSTTTADPRYRCLEYSEMVNIFKPLIVNSLHVHDILPSLKFLENHDDIYEQVKNHSPKSAVESLLDELERSEEIGKWQKFIDALSANGYTYIVDNIRGYRFICHHYQIEYIKNLTPKIGKMIVARELLPHLLAKDLISDSDKEDIQRVDENQGNYAAAVLLLDRIHRMHRYWYVVFIETLIDASMEEVAADLQIPELIESKRTKDDYYSRSKRNKNQNNNSQSIDDVCLDENVKNPTRCSEKKKRCHRRNMLPCVIGRVLPPLPPHNDNTNMTQSKSAISTDDNISNEEARSRCLEFSEMVQIFKPLIVQNLLVMDILPSLPFLENYDDIYAESRNHSPKQAVVKLLNELETSGELGKWQKFIDALIANGKNGKFLTSGYTYIVDNIRGYRFISHEYQTEYIRRLTPKIGKMIVTRELLPHLRAKDLISDSDNENIQRLDTNHGNFAAAVELLDRIHRKHSNWYLLFIEALTEANMEEAAVDLRIPELLESPRTKVTDGDSAFDDFSYSLPPLPTETKGSETEEKSEHVDSDALDGSLQSETDEFYGYEEYEAPPPPIPPRIRRNQRNKPYTVTSDTCDTYDDTCNYEDNTLETCIYEKRPEIYSKDISHVNDNANSECKDNAADSKFKTLHDELDEMKKEHCDIHLEVGLLEQKSTLFTEINSGIRRRREILSDIALKEKENNALQMEPCANDETNVGDVKTDDYYPSTTKLNNGERSKAYSTRPVLPTKHTIDYRERFHLGKLGVLNPIPLFVESPMSMIQIFSPNFESRSILSQMFENDSGVALDIDLELDCI